MSIVENKVEIFVGKGKTKEGLIKIGAGTLTICWGAITINEEILNTGINTFKVDVETDQIIVVNIHISKVTIDVERLKTHQKQSVKVD